MTRSTPFPKFLNLWAQTHGRSLRLLVLGVYLPLQIFAVLALRIWGLEGGLSWDMAIITAIHESAGAALDPIAQVATHLGSASIVAIGVVALAPLLVLRKRWRSLVYLGITLFGGGALNLLAKVVWHRTRPHFWESGYPLPQDFSFPSGHAMTSMLFVAALVVLTWKTRWSGIVLVLGAAYVLTIGWTRVYLGVHYPSDIVAGWLLALAWAIGISALVKPVLSPSKESKLVL